LKLKVFLDAMLLEIILKRGISENEETALCPENST